MGAGPSRSLRSDGGASAVELAILLPVLLLVVFGIIDFGRMLNAQITITEAAHEGARWSALRQTTPTPANRAVTAAVGLSPAPTANVTACPAAPAVTDQATAVVTYQFSFVTPFNALAGMFGGGGGANTVQLRATGVMRCGG